MQPLRKAEKLSTMDREANAVPVVYTFRTLEKKKSWFRKVHVAVTGGTALVLVPSLETVIAVSSCLLLFQHPELFQFSENRYHEAQP